jgi:hypothetical protein
VRMPVRRVYLGRRLEGRPVLRLPRQACACAHRGLADQGRATRMTRRLARQVKAAAEAMEKQSVSVAAGGEEGADGTLDTVTQTSDGVDPHLVRARRACTAAGRRQFMWRRRRKFAPGWRAARKAPRRAAPRLPCVQSV